jgi:hypothetical protein
MHNPESKHPQPCFFQNHPASTAPSGMHKDAQQVNLTWRTHFCVPRRDFLDARADSGENLPYSTDYLDK